MSRCPLRLLILYHRICCNGSGVAVQHKVGPFSFQQFFCFRVCISRILLDFEPFNLLGSDSVYAFIVSQLLFWWQFGYSLVTGVLYIPSFCRHTYDNFSIDIHRHLQAATSGGIQLRERCERRNLPIIRIKDSNKWYFPEGQASLTKQVDANQHRQLPRSSIPCHTEDPLKCRHSLWIYQVLHYYCRRYSAALSAMFGESMAQAHIRFFSISSWFLPIKSSWFQARPDFNDRSGAGQMNHLFYDNTFRLESIHILLEWTDIDHLAPCRLLFL